MKKIAFAGTDGRTLLSALVTATAKSERYLESFEGVVIRGTPSMPVFCEIMNWPVAFIETASNSVTDYTEAIIAALREEKIDYVIPMPEALLFDGLVDAVEQAGFGDHIVGLTRSAARELASRGVTVNGIAPGYIETDMTSDLPEKVKDKILAEIPLGRLGTADDIAAAAVYLASEDARYVTGQIIHVNGGMFMG